MINSEYLLELDSSSITNSAYAWFINSLLFSLRLYVTDSFWLSKYLIPMKFYLKNIKTILMIYLI